MEIQYTEISETEDACEVEMLISDDMDPEHATAYVEVKVLLPKQANPRLAQLQKDSLEVVHTLIGDKIQQAESRMGA
ncbi:MAG: hypothetical protein ACE5GK_07365 [Nitrospiria bacterium]